MDYIEAWENHNVPLSMRAPDLGGPIGTPSSLRP
jgi:hypothetical protein